MYLKSTQLSMPPLRTICLPWHKGSESFTTTLTLIKLQPSLSPSSSSLSTTSPAIDTTVLATDLEKLPIGRLGTYNQNWVLLKTRFFTSMFLETLLRATKNLSNDHGSFLSTLSISSASRNSNNTL